ncbi:MAG TPA: HEAT repeat domain-containing protein [Polyangiaceae bacterium]|jgi:HEAT repeat protein|nr:HEAT repeat domain-containing protein [Polyangiaceae bacterium]
MFGLEPLPRTLEAALRDLKSNTERIRASALRDLGRHGGTEDSRAASDAMAAVLDGDPSPEVRGAAALALADAGAHDAIEAVLRAAGDVNVHVRQMALIALGELGDATEARVASVVKDAANDPVAALRFQALIAANALALPQAGAMLLEGTNDADGEVRHIALCLLEERATGDTEFVLDDAVRAAARARLTDVSLRVRLVAAILLARTGDRSGSVAIVDGIAARDAAVDPADRQAAIVLAGELGLRAAAPALTRHAFGVFGRGSRFVFEARIALATLGDARAKSSILRGLTAFNRDVRTLAVVAAGRAHLVEALPLLEAMQADERRAESLAVTDALLALRDSREA